MNVVLKMGKRSILLLEILSQFNFIIGIFTLEQRFLTFLYSLTTYQFENFYVLPDNFFAFFFFGY